MTDGQTETARKKTKKSPASISWELLFYYFCAKRRREPPQEEEPSVSFLCKTRLTYSTDYTTLASTDAPASVMKSAFSFKIEAQFKMQQRTQRQSCYLLRLADAR